MSNVKSPLVDQLDRLNYLLQDFGRDELFLEVKFLHPFTSQLPQVVCAIKDRGGDPLSRPGYSRPVTFRLDPDHCGQVEVGHCFRVARRDGGVQVEHLVPSFS